MVTRLVFLYQNYFDGIGFPPGFLENEYLREREQQLMRSFYPQTARKIQRQVEEVCNQLDYPGSFLYDEYPDRFTLEQLCKKIHKKLQETPSSCSGNQMERSPRPFHWILGNEKEQGLLDELIHVLLFQEIQKRRCRRKNCGTYF
jgi:hypothetical protein